MSVICLAHFILFKLIFSYLLFSAKKKKVKIKNKNTKILLLLVI